MFGSFHPLERMYIMTFSSDIKAFATKTNRNLEDVRAYSAITLFTNIIMATPVGNPDFWQGSGKAPTGYTGGRLRGNWQASINTPENSTTKQIDPNGGKVLKDMTAKMLTVKGDESLFMTNNLPYAARIEYGHSRKQRPMGMVRVSIAAFEDAVKSALQKVDR